MLAHKIDEPMIVSPMIEEERKKHQELNDKIEELDKGKARYAYATAMATTDSGPYAAAFVFIAARNSGCEGFPDDAGRVFGCKQGQLNDVYPSPPAGAQI